MNYVDMCNEVLVRMREEEITSVIDPDNDPEQKMVCKLVNDARAFVERSHAWNALRKVWVIDLALEQYKYNLSGAAEQSSIYLVKYGSGSELREVPSLWMSKRGRETGSPSWYAPSHVDRHTVQMHIYPRPDESFGGTGDIFEYTRAEYGLSSYAQPEKQLSVFGYGQGEPLTTNDSEIVVPNEPVMHYALAMAQRERGEAGGQNSAEIFALAKQFLSDAISWDVTNSSGEYVWVAN